MWASQRSGSISKLTIEQFLGDSFLGHPVDMAKPAKSALEKDGVQARDFCFFQDLCVSDVVIPSDVQDQPKVLHVKGF